MASTPAPSATSVFSAAPPASPATSPVIPPNYFATNTFLYANCTTATV
jgi:hypothetical protein